MNRLIQKMNQGSPHFRAAFLEFPTNLGVKFITHDIGPGLAPIGYFPLPNVNAMPHLPEDFYSLFNRAQNIRLDPGVTEGRAEGNFKWGKRLFETGPVR